MSKSELAECVLDITIAKNRLERVLASAESDIGMSFDVEMDIVRARKLLTDILERLKP